MVWTSTRKQWTFASFSLNVNILSDTKKKQKNEWVKYTHFQSSYIGKENNQSLSHCRKLNFRKCYACSDWRRLHLCSCIFIDILVHLSTHTPLYINCSCFLYGFFSCLTNGQGQMYSLRIVYSYRFKNCSFLIMCTIFQWKINNSG